MENLSRLTELDRARLALATERVNYRAAQQTLAAAELAELSEELSKAYSLEDSDSVNVVTGEIGRGVPRLSE